MNMYQIWRINSDGTRIKIGAPIAYMDSLCIFLDQYKRGNNLTDQGNGYYLDSNGNQISLLFSLV